MAPDKVPPAKRQQQSRKSLGENRGAFCPARSPSHSARAWRENCVDKKIINRKMFYVVAMRFFSTILISSLSSQLSLSFSSALALALALTLAFQVAFKFSDGSLWSN